MTIRQVVVALAYALTAIVAGTCVTAWWILPVGVTVLLAYSIWRAERASAD